jgi:hypothetical protein
MVTPREDRPSTDSGTKLTINMVPQQRPTLVRTVNGTERMTQIIASASWETAGGAGQDVPSRVNLPPQSDNHGRT